MVSATGNTMTALGILVKNNFSRHFTLKNQEESSVFQIPLLELIPNQQRKAVIKVWKRREKSRTYFSRKLTIIYVKIHQLNEKPAQMRLGKYGSASTKQHW